MNTFSILFHLAATTDPEFMSGDPTNTYLTMEANRLNWDRVPCPDNEKASFATGYIMGREGMDPHPTDIVDPNYKCGYNQGVLVFEGAMPRPGWDPAMVAN